MREYEDLKLVERMKKYSSRKKLAKKADVSYTYIGMLINGFAEFSNKVKIKIERALAEEKL